MKSEVRAFRRDDMPTVIVSSLPPDVQAGDVVMLRGPDGRRRGGKRREWPWVLATLGLIFLSGALLFVWMVGHPDVRDVGLIGLGWLIVFVAGMAGGFTIGRAWPDA